MIPYSETAANEVDTLVTAVDRAALRWPDRIAWTFDPGESLTFADIADRSRALAAGLARAGVHPGDAVGVMLGNTPWQPLTWFALARLGARCVALNPKYGPVDLAHVLETAECRLVVATSDTPGAIGDPVVGGCSFSTVADLLQGAGSTAAYVDI